LNWWKKFGGATTGLVDKKRRRQDRSEAMTVVEMAR
jgi:hypothetical protein